MRPLSSLATVKIGIIGGGPNGLYILNGLVSAIQEFPEVKFKIFVFDKHGNFGSGWAHSPRQPKTSMLNRIVGQLSYTPDESNGVQISSIANNGFTFSEWCQIKYKETNDERYNNSPDDFPTRELYGESLVEVFTSTTATLKALGCDVCLVADEVVRISRDENGKYIAQTTKGYSGKLFDFIFLATGHQETKNNFYFSAQLKRVVEYYNHAYPLFDIPQWREKNIGVIGMGLTAIDVMLYYTESKGGEFYRVQDKLIYQPSGNEPKKLYALSRSGYFTYSRPHNYKEVDLEKYEHMGYFLTKDFINQLRTNVGLPAHIESSPGNHRLQLDFERHVLPIIILELQLCYYRILFGPEILKIMLEQTQSLVQYFSSGHNEYNLVKETAIEYLTSKIESIAREVIFKVRKFLNEQAIDSVDGVVSDVFVKRFFRVVYGDILNSGDDLHLVAKSLRNRTSPWAHSPNPEDHLFNWDYIVNPIKYVDYGGESTYKEKLLKFMMIDRLQSQQGNIENPYKGSCDDVFRDLRQTVVYAIDFGGITPSSYTRMLKDFYAVHNRAANGNCIELMEKIEALIEADIVDVTYAKANIQICGQSVYLHSLSDAGQLTTVDALIDGKLHSFSVKNSRNSLFAKMVEDGIASFWVHKDQFGVANNLSGFNITREFQLINRDGNKECIFCAGQPSEGIMFFQNGSIRPNVNHHVANDILMCLGAFRKELILNLHNIDRLAAKESLETHDVHQP